VAALLCSLRTDALRVCLLAALRVGKKAMYETFADTTERMFGEPAPETLAAVLPLLRAAQAPSFIGALGAVEARDAIVAAHDEDWFRSPHAAAAMRLEDARPTDDDARPKAEDYERCMTTTRERFEALLG
jgi:hypothetical protein